MATKPSQKQLEKDVAEALAVRDGAGVLQALEKGLALDWQDEKGRGLLHYAAAFGDEALAENLLAKGVPSLLRDKNFDSAKEIAAAYGHDSLAQKFSAAFSREAGCETEKPLPYKTLQALRDAGTTGGVNHFYRLAREGRFAQVIELAKKDGKGFAAQDLLGRGPNGETVTQALAREGQVPRLLDTDLWLKNGKGFQSFWNAVPAAAKAGLDANAFMVQLRQARLAAYTPPVLRRKNFKK